MTNTTHTSLMPHHRLRAYGVAVQLLGAVRAARIRDRVLRDQALRAAILKQLEDCSYEMLAYHLADSATCRTFCRIGMNDKPPKKATLQTTPHRRCSIVSRLRRLAPGTTLKLGGGSGPCYQVGMLIELIRAQAREAMKSRDTVAREILRVALGEVQTEEARREGALDDAAVEKILRKLMKSNAETIAATDDSERRATLERENAVLEALLPKTLSEDEIVATLGAVAEDIKAAKADGPATGIAMKHLRSQDATVDGKTVAAAVKRLRGSA